MDHSGWGAFFQGLAGVGPVALGALVGAVYKAVTQPSKSVVLSFVNAVASLGIGIIFGGLLAPSFQSVFSGSDEYASAAAGAMCTIFSQAVIDFVRVRVFGDQDNAK